MRISLDFGDGAGALDYTAALATPLTPASSNVPKNVEAITVERQRGDYARCRGTINAAPLALQPPLPGCRVAVRSDAGALLFSGVITTAPERAALLRNADAPVSFEAVEDAFLTNTAPDTSLQPASATTHALDLNNNAVVLAENTMVADRADDVLVTGALEPVTYVTELFQGDGTTATFALTQKPFVPSGTSTLLDDSFTETGFRNAVWRFVDTGQHINMGTGGLRLTGGNGFDGQTYMAAQQLVELGGTLCAEMRGVLLQPGSAGVLLGMYGNVVTAGTCFAGIQVNASAGAQSLTALVSGAAVGTAFQWSVGHSYTLRVRLHSAETQRVLTTYQALVNGTVQAWGGGLVDTPMQMVFEVVDEGLASSTPATVLYAGAVSSSIARAVFAPVNSVSLVASVAEISLKQQGSAWVTTTQTDGAVTIRRPGTLDTGEDYRISGTSLEFFAGRVPEPGAQVTVRYRLAQRAQARVHSAAAVALAQQCGLPGLRQRQCRVTAPEPRSAADCAAAAEALLGFYGSPAYGVRGTASMPNAVATADVQPGDAVALPLSATAVNVPVERVTIRSAHSVPEILQYEVAFEQDAAHGLSFHTETGAAADAALPAAVYVAPSTAALPGFAVTVVGTAALQVDAGAAAPVAAALKYDDMMAVGARMCLAPPPIASWCCAALCAASAFRARHLPSAFTCGCTTDLKCRCTPRNRAW